MDEVANLAGEIGGNEEEGQRRKLKEEVAAEAAKARAKEAEALFAKVKEDAIAAAEAGDDDAAKKAPAAAAPAATAEGEGEGEGKGEREGEGEGEGEDAAAAAAAPELPKQMTVDEASKLYEEAKTAAEEAAAAAVTAREEHTKASVAMRHRLIELIIHVIRLPPSIVTAYARRLAMSMVWGGASCARLPNSIHREASAFLNSQRSETKIWCQIC